MECKVGSQEISGVTGKSVLEVQNKAGQRLKFGQENALVIANILFQQHKRRLYTWTSPDGQYRNQIDYILAAEDGEALSSQQKQDLDYGLDHQLLIAKFRLKLRKVGKTIRPFGYDLNQGETRSERQIKREGSGETERQDTEKKKRGGDRERGSRGERGRETHGEGRRGEKERERRKEEMGEKERDRV